MKNPIYEIKKVNDIWTVYADGEFVDNFNSINESVEKIEELKSARKKEPQLGSAVST